MHINTSYIPPQLLGGPSCTENDFDQAEKLNTCCTLSLVHPLPRYYNPCGPALVNCAERVKSLKIPDDGEDEKVMSQDKTGVVPRGFRRQQRRLAVVCRDRKKALCLVVPPLLRNPRSTSLSSICFSQISSFGKTMHLVRLKWASGAERAKTRTIGDSSVL